MSKKATRIFQEQAHIEKTLLKNISEYRPTGDEDFDALVRQHLLKSVHERSVSFILSLYDIAWDSKHPTPFQPQALAPAFAGVPVVS